ncbi:MAG: TlpA family protein disulfide reductase [Candidatus Marinimicrobia bacterium]|nr:TlpA family protein disulfide reductase [Candidatus Neomarinimicrobiota bacterium]MBL7011058.1 TlpA family protein disulfide reductase [Candidatus Neomarinimicrobiota bacterium]MBL7031445.1 TlpA family protein disulfide reductase [Candidatus Neomarinimicrobiota bacterium]
MSSIFGQAEANTPGMKNGDEKDLKIGDVAPSWALMYGPGQFEFLKNWSEEEGKRLRKFTTQPDRHAVLMSFFATWCQPCMKELPILEEVYQKYKNERIKFFLVDITEATRTNPGYEDMPKAGPFLKKKGVTMQILFDTRGTVMKRYNAQTLPRLFMMDGNRIITQTRRGFHAGEEEKFTKELSEEIERLLAELPPPKNEK